MTCALSKLKRTRAAMALLQARFPVLFVPSQTGLRPLALGIQQALVTRLAEETPDSDLKAIGWALRKWCKTEAYKRALAKGGPRYDLNGQPAGMVDEQHQHNAQLLLLDVETDRAAKAQLKAQRQTKPAKPKPAASPASPPAARPPGRPQRVARTTVVKGKVILKRPAPAVSAPPPPPPREVHVIVKKRRTLVKPAE